MTTTPAPQSANPSPSTADAVFTVLLGLGQAVLSFFAFAFSGFFMMASDSCESPAECHSIEQTAWVAMGAVWVAIAVGALVSIVGAVRSARRGEVMWIWPVLGGMTLALGFLLGFGLISETGA